jgi:hypothetical protein
MPSWADQVQAISTAIGVLVTIGGFLLVYRQIRQVSQASRANTHAAIFAHCLELTRVMLDKPEIKPYLSDGKKLAEGDPLCKEVDLVCEMFGDFYEHVSLQRESLPEQSRACWDKAIAFRCKKNSALRNYIEKHRSVYAADLFASIDRGEKLLGTSGNGKAVTE